MVFDHFSEQFLGTDVAIVSTSDQMPDLEASSDSLERMEKDVSPLKYFFEIKIQSVSVQGIILIEVFLVYNEEA